MSQLGRRPPLEGQEEEEKVLPVAKQRRITIVYSRIGYRRKTIQRGVTKQKGRRVFLF